MKSCKRVWNCSNVFSNCFKSRKTNSINPSHEVSRLMIFNFFIVKLTLNCWKQYLNFLDHFENCKLNIWFRDVDKKFVSTINDLESEKPFLGRQVCKRKRNRCVLTFYNELGRVPSYLCLMAIFYLMKLNHHFLNVLNRKQIKMIKFMLNFAFFELCVISIACLIICFQKQSQSKLLCWFDVFNCLLRF